MAGGHVWQGGVHGKGGHAWQRGGMHGKWGGGVCMVKGGAFMAKGGMCSEGGHAWQRGGMHGIHPPLRDMASQCTGGTHPTGMHCLLNVKLDVSGYKRVIFQSCIYFISLFPL